jgi:hypothetical protein
MEYQSYLNFYYVNTKDKEFEHSTFNQTSNSNYSTDIHLIEKINFCQDFHKKKDQAFKTNILENEQENIFTVPKSPKMTYNKNSFNKIKEISDFIL